MASQLQDAQVPGAPPAGAARPLIEISGLVKRYKGTLALDGLDMRVGGGSIYGFVGPNGAGKTTTMRILATLLAADRGEAWIAGEDVRPRTRARVRAKHRLHARLLRRLRQPDGDRVPGLLCRRLRRPAPRARRTNAELLELVDLAHKRNEFVEGLSRGMKQRLGLARCLVHNPEVLLLDEPASGMDPRARYEMREIVKELQRLGKTVLVSSHILLELAEMCTHIGIVQDGRLLREGPVDQVLRSLQPGRAIELRVLGERCRRRERCCAAQPERGQDIRSAARRGTRTGRGGLTGARSSSGPSPTTRGLRDMLRALVDGGLTVISFAAQRETWRRCLCS